MYDIYHCTKCDAEHAGYMGERVYQGLWTAHDDYRAICADRRCKNEAHKHSWMIKTNA